jgi:agmatine/peptidylarginine deiminase
VKECKVLIITTDSVNVTNQLVNAGIPMDSVEFVNTPYNTIWVRDYVPLSVYKNDVDSLWIVDWIYNRPRANDDASPVGVANHLKLPIYEATAAPFNWVHTGGNHLPDGMGTAFSSNLVLNENPGKTEAQIDSIANLFLGVTQHIKFPTLPYDGIHHLDMHMRVIDEETIFFGEYPAGVADGPQIESNIDYLQEMHQTAFGNKYKILRLPIVPTTSAGGAPGASTGWGTRDGGDCQVAHMRPAHARYGPKWRERPAASTASASYLLRSVSTGWSRQLIAFDASGLIDAPGESPR